MVLRITWGEAFRNYIGFEQVFSRFLLEPPIDRQAKRAEDHR